MAILDAVPGIQVTVVSNGEPLQEYPDKSDFKSKKISAPTHRTYCCYIECKSNDRFQLRFEVTPDFVKMIPQTDLCFWAKVDGESIGGKSAPAIIKSSTWSSNLESSIRRVSETESAYQKLKFEPLNIVDDDDPARLKHDKKRIKELGEIVVHVHRTIVSRDEHESTTNTNLIYKDPVTEVAEKALKGKEAISHRIKFGPIERVAQPSNPMITYIEGRSTPLAIFRFKYRSREVLEQMMIITRSISPDPTATETPRASLKHASAMEERIPPEAYDEERGNKEVNSCCMSCTCIPSKHRSVKVADMRVSTTVKKSCGREKVVRTIQRIVTVERKGVLPKCQNRSTESKNLCKSTPKMTPEPAAARCADAGLKHTTKTKHTSKMTVPKPAQSVVKETTKEAPSGRKAATVTKTSKVRKYNVPEMSSPKAGVAKAVEVMKGCNSEEEKGKDSAEDVQKPSKAPDNRAKRTTPKVKLAKIKIQAKTPSGPNN